MKFVVLKKRRSNDILLSCGAQIKYYRKQKGYTQEQVSERLDMDFSQYGKIERGLTNVTISTLSDIAIVLDIEPFYLLKPKRESKQ